MARTGAILGAVGALYMSDPTAQLTTFTHIPLIANVTRKIFTAAYGFRYWPELDPITKIPITFLIEKGVPLTKGKHTSAVNPLLDLSQQTHKKFKIQADLAMAASEITLILANCTDGSTTAAEMKAQIRALTVVNGADYSGADVIYTPTEDPANGYYTITSGIAGIDSKIRITAGGSYNVAGDLKIGTLGMNTDGTDTWTDITIDCLFDYLRGRVTLASALNAAYHIRASGKRVPAVKLAQLLSVSLAPTKDKVESTNFDSEKMFKEWIPSFKSWTAKAKRWFDVNQVAWKLYADETETPLLFVLFTKDGTSKECLAGFGFLDGYDPNFDLTALQAEDLSIVGNSGLSYETGP